MTNWACNHLSHTLKYFYSEPFIVNPRKHITESNMDEIYNQFEMARGKKRDSGPPMYIVAPYDNCDDEEQDIPMDKNPSHQSKQTTWRPSTASPEWVVVCRTAALAKRSYQYMMSKLVGFDKSSDWSAIFHESSSAFHSYDALLRVSPDFIVDLEASSTGTDLSSVVNENGVLESSYTKSMKARIQGPKAMRRKVYKNLQHNSSDKSHHSILLSWNPIESLLSVLRNKFGQYALFFYNELTPEVIGLLWRPDVFKPLSFSAMTAEHSMPQDADPINWKNDSLVVRNHSDLLREMTEHFQGIITTVKILKGPGVATKKRKRQDLD
jgi:Nrap protein domain 6